VYGLVNLKTHARLCLIVRKEPDGIRRYAHLGTGNYNASTARVYTDVALLTTRPAIVEDVTNVLNYLTGYSSQSHYDALLVAPVSLRRQVQELIDREAAHALAGRHARIIFKLNGLTDAELIQHLYFAAQAGVFIDLIVRGICCRRPGVPGISEHVTVRSIAGRFLEHSRIFWFENGGEPDVFIASADLMERNLDRRVEVLCPVLDASLQSYLREGVLDAYLHDTERAWTLDASRAYTPPVRVGDGGPLNAQQFLLNRHTLEYQRES
jgi:polyphosphate kinase